MPLYPTYLSASETLLHEHEQIPEPRKAKLQQLADYITQKEGKTINLNFICTHNSRRSHISQIWAAVGAAHFGLTGVYTFSGGTEATAFNPRAVAAIQRIGFKADDPGGANPLYRVSFGEDLDPLVSFSKTYDDAANPTQHFAAIMTCSDADEHCPFIPGAEFRLPLTYEDPKLADDTPEEANRYDERVRQIGREMLYAMQLVAKKH